MTLAEITNVAADTLATFIVEGLSAGTATLMLTADHSDYNPATVTVEVTVSTPALVISNVSALDINLEARTTEELTVTVSAEAGEPNDVMLTAMVLGEEECGKCDSSGDKQCSSRHNGEVYSGGS